MSVFRHVFLRWCDVCYFFPRCCGVDSPPMSPSLLYLKPLRNSKTFLHVICKSKKKTNLLCIPNNVFQCSKIRTLKRNAKKCIKTEKDLESSPFWNPESTELESRIQYSESGIHRVESRIQDFPGFPYMGRHLGMKNKNVGNKNKVTASLASIQRPGHWAHNCKMAIAAGQEKSVRYPH